MLLKFCKAVIYLRELKDNAQQIYVKYYESIFDLRTQNKIANICYYERVWLETNLLKNVRELGVNISP